MQNADVAYKMEIHESQRYDLVYAKGEDWMNLVRYILRERMNLYCIEANISNRLHPCKYYVIECSKAAALRRFRNTFPWLDAIFSVSVCNNNDAERILTSPAHNIIV